MITNSQGVTKASGSHESDMRIGEVKDGERQAGYGGTDRRDDRNQIKHFLTPGYKGLVSYTTHRTTYVLLDASWVKTRGLYTLRHLVHV